MSVKCIGNVRDSIIGNYQNSNTVEFADILLPQIQSHTNAGIAERPGYTPFECKIVVRSFVHRNFRRFGCYSFCSDSKQILPPGFFLGSDLGDSVNKNRTD